MRNWRTFPLSKDLAFRVQLLQFATDFSEYIFLDSCENEAYGKNNFHYLLAAGNYVSVETNAGNAFSQLQNLIDTNHDWIFGYFGYDLKNEIENLHSENPDHIGFSDMVFFVPEVIVIVEDEIKIGALKNNHDEILNAIWSKHAELTVGNYSTLLNQRIAKPDFISKIEAIKRHIVEGDIYEMNLCQEFYAENADIDPLVLFDKLCSIAKAPFSSLLRWKDKFMISSSPERFIKKSGDKIISQPIKGTIKRSDDPEQDEQLKLSLASSEKDRAENVMIVDLMRNDFARSCLPGSVQVDELFSVYSFENVHQMVSTVSGELRPDMHVADVIKNAFPMGSMTGAPKVKAMELIEKYEESKRGLFSGSIGYFTPELDFDFNVIIRSILWNSGNKYLSIQAGGAVVFDSEPEAEYNECLLKIVNLKAALNAEITQLKNN